MRWYEDQAAIEAIYRKSLYYAKSRFGERYAQDVVHSALECFLEPEYKIKYESQSALDIQKLLYKNMRWRFDDILKAEKRSGMSEDNQDNQDSSKKTIKYHYVDIYDIEKSGKISTYEQLYDCGQELSSLVIDRVLAVLPDLQQEIERELNRISQKNAAKAEFLRISLFEDSDMTLPDIANFVGYKATGLSEYRTRFLETCEKALDLPKGTIRTLLEM